MCWTNAWYPASGLPSHIESTIWEWYSQTIIARVLRRVSSDNLGMVAAGVAFYSLLALFPGIAALISIYGLWPIPRR